MASEEVLKQRKNAKATISIIGNFLEKKKDQKLDILQNKTREEALEKAFEKFCEAQDEIDNISSSSEETAERMSLEERYYDILTNLKRLAQSGAEQNGSSALVLNNSDLADVQKLIYLKSSLKGKPLKLVETLSLTSANLQMAIKILTERYENKLATIYLHIKGLVELPSITKSNPISLREFVVSIKQNTESLKNLQVPVESWNLILVYILSQKLDFHTRKAYELERGPAQLPTLENLLKFVEKRCLATDNLSSPEIKRKTAHFAISNSDIRSDNNATKIQNACTYCKAYDHAIYRCSKFKDLTGFQRKQFVFNKRLCFKCFLKHPVDQCRWKNCPICGQSHHSLLHSQGHSKPMFNNNQNGNNFRSQNKVYLNQPQGQGSAGSAGPSQGCVVPKTVSLCENSPLDNSLNESCQSRNNNQRRSEGNSDVQNVNALSALASSQSQHVLIATAMVLIPDSNGKIITAKAILDNGSQTSLVTSDLVKKLNFWPYTKTVQVSGVSGKKSMCNQMVDCDIISRVDSRKRFKVFCSVMDRITCPLPQVTLDPEKLDIPESLLLADPSYATPSKIDLLLDADLYYEILAPGLLKLGDGFPVLLNTYLGWVIGGSTPQSCISHLNVTETVSLFTSTVEINDLMQRFWALEEVPQGQVLSSEDELSEQIFKDTTKILKNGRFQLVTVQILHPMSLHVVLWNLLIKNKTEFPLAAEVLKGQCYMDDILGELVQLVTLLSCENN
ncbi:hypothetical protein NQ314_005595 [Rhamnusium bicolor]|uniref:Peptidase aspartic putative domain-containing protein n=1 Tax=Rhamnusium bicolor TaxID=1586634 RepID=A0AAV8ZGI2_9CUCU|nr:hypothetical protein NQ314_005595 [Rhamnusium bicolor]